MKSIKRVLKELEIQALENAIGEVYAQIDALEEKGFKLSNTILTAKRQLTLIEEQENGTERR